MDIYSFGITQIATFLLVLTRVGGIFTTAPVFSNFHITPMVRVTIAVALSFVFLPMAKYNPAGLDFLPFAMAIAKEAIVGIAMGFFASLLFAAVHMAASMIDLQIGFSFGSVVDPMNREQNAVLGQFYNMVAVLLFLAINGHHMMITGLAESFSVLPLGQLSYTPALAGGVTQTFTVVFFAAMKIGVPVVGAVFLTDVALGILSRTVPQLNVLVVGMPAKIAVGLIAIFIMLPVELAVMCGLFSGLHRDLIVLIKHMI